jgi:hypothetical protein
VAKTTEEKTKITAELRFYPVSMAAATAATTRSSRSRGCRGRGRRAIAVTVRRAKHRKLNGIFLTGALGAGNLLILVQDNPFERRFTIVANVFVNGHEFLSISKLN